MARMDLSSFTDIVYFKYILATVWKLYHNKKGALQIGGGNFRLCQIFFLLCVSVYRKSLAELEGQVDDRTVSKMLRSQ